VSAAATADAAHPSSARPPAARRYGQHHLVDRGTLDAIIRLADVQPRDVVLEVGAADGLLTRPLLAVATHVHAFEVDCRFAPALERLSQGHEALSVHLGDALRADLSALRPPPTVFVANLAYNIAIPVIMKSLQELPDVHRWAVMVQKELGDRLFARPSTKAYSAVSVQVQLSCRPLASRPIPRSVFSPRPRVDSVFVVFERRDDAPSAAGRDAVQRLARAAFAQRRKMLANSLCGLALPPRVEAAPGASRGGDMPGDRADEAVVAALAEQTVAAAPAEPAAPGEPTARSLPAGTVLSAAAVREALGSLGLNPSARPEELTPGQFAELARALGGGER